MTLPSHPAPPPPGSAGLYENIVDLDHTYEDPMEISPVPGIREYHPKRFTYVIFCGCLLLYM